MYDWETIRAEYIATDISYKDLASKYGVSYDLVTKKGREGGWREARQKAREKATSKVVNIAADRRARSVGNIMKAADKLSKRLIDDVDLLDGARDVSDIAKALKYAADTLAQVYGIQTPAQIHRQRMDEEKLKIERERFELEKKRQDAVGNTEPVRIMIVKPEEVEGGA